MRALNGVLDVTFLPSHATSYAIFHEMVIIIIIIIMVIFKCYFSGELIALT